MTLKHFCLHTWKTQKLCLKEQITKQEHLLNIYLSSGHTVQAVDDLAWIQMDSITCSAMDALQWMGAVRMRVQTADKNITIIHTTPSVKVLWSQKQHVCKKQIYNKHNFNFKSLLKSSPLSIIVLSLVKRSFCLNQERNLHRSSPVYKRKQSKTSQNTYVGGFWCERKLRRFFTKGSVIINYELIFWPEVTV